MEYIGNRQKYIVGATRNPSGIENGELRKMVFDTAFSREMKASAYELKHKRLSSWPFEEKSYLCSMNRWQRYCWVLSIFAFAGCNNQETRIDLTTFDQSGQTQQHYAEFRRASYRKSHSGMLELVLRSEQPSSIDPTQTITQIVYIKSLWTPKPGITFAEESQINARVQYAIITPPTGVRYDGAGFISYSRKRHTGEIVGKIESGTLAPRLRMGDAVEPFGTARFTGTFCAQENPRDVVTTVQMLESQFSKPLNQPGGPQQNSN